MADIIPPQKSLIGEKIRLCPKCHSGQRTRRISRALWMRIFPGSVNMECGQCGHRFWRMS